MGFGIFVMGYNPILCDFKSFLVIWYSRPWFLLCNFFLYKCFGFLCFGFGFLCCSKWISLLNHQKSSLITRPPPFLLFFIFIFLFPFYLCPFIFPSFCLFLLVPCRYSNDNGNMSHLRHRQELEILVVWPLMLVCKEK
jgi:hypothetical protein